MIKANPQMIKVTPGPGERVRDPFSPQGGFLPPEGAVLADDPYWRRRAREGSLTIDIVAIEDGAAKKKGK